MTDFQRDILDWVLGAVLGLVLGAAFGFVMALLINAAVAASAPETLIETTRQTAQLAQETADRANLYSLISITIQTLGGVALAYIGLKTAMINQGQKEMAKGQIEIAATQREVRDEIVTLKKNTDGINSALQAALAHETKENYLAKGILAEKGRQEGRQDDYSGSASIVDKIEESTTKTVSVVKETGESIVDRLKDKTDEVADDVADAARKAADVVKHTAAVEANKLKKKK